MRLDDGRLAASNIKHDKFAVIQWQQRLGNVPITDVAALPDDDPHLRCDEEGCVYRKDPLILAMPLVESAALEDCAHASIVIAHFPIAPCGADKVIDQMALEQHGAAALYFTSGKPRLVFSHKTRGARPWSPGWREGR